MSNKRNLAPLCAALALGAALALPAAAKTYCCTDKSGHRICADTFPEQCEDRAYKEFGAKGVRNVEAPLTAEQKAQREAEAARQKDEERSVAEQRRKDRALLNTYASEKDIDVLRDRAIADLESAGRQTQEKYDAAIARKQQLAKELEFYTKKPVPPSLKAQIKDNEVEIEAQKKAIDDRKKDVAATRLRFEEDRKRYRELTRGAAGK
ncbi:MAG: hypothetical protein PHY45_16530 [Rhodocyclaceae bacterium]|nr:hypothetical protein [Rhodocyclaceae bacterium]